MTTSESKPALKKLSEILAAYTPLMLTRIITDWEQGVSSDVEALPTEGTFEIIYLLGNGKQKKEERQEEIVRMSEQTLAWFSKKAQESRLTYLGTHGVIDTNQEKLESGEDDFDELLSQRRKFMATKQSEKSSPVAQPARTRTATEKQKQTPAPGEKTGSSTRASQSSGKLAEAKLGSAKSSDLDSDLNKTTPLNPDPTTPAT